MHRSGCFGLRDADTVQPHAKPRVVIMTPARMSRRRIDVIKNVVRDVPSGWRLSYPNYGDAVASYTISDVRKFCLSFFLLWLIGCWQVYGAKLSRLRVIKRKYNPLRVFVPAGLRISPASDNL